MIAFLDLFRINNIALGRYKIHLATGPDGSVLREFFEGKFQRFQEEQHKKNFQCNHILSLISLDNDLWLFVGVYQVLGVGPGTTTPYLYQTELLSGLDDLIGRVVVRFKRPSRNAYTWGHAYGKLLEVAEIKPRRMEVMEFPGYNKVLLSYPDLCLIVNRQEPGWKAALSNVQGIYLIADQISGKQYIGSAYGAGGIWERWTSYALTCHGGNIELQTVLDKQGLEYGHNFQYAILEIADLNVTTEYLLERENHWKGVLLSREFGYNKN